MKIKFSCLHLYVNFDKFPFPDFSALFYFTLHICSVKQTDNHFAAIPNHRLLDEGAIQIDVKIVDSSRIGNNADKLSCLVPFQRITTIKPITPFGHEVLLVLDNCIKDIHKSLIVFAAAINALVSLASTTPLSCSILNIITDGPA